MLQVAGLTAVSAVNGKMYPIWRTSGEKCSDDFKGIIHFEINF